MVDFFINLNPYYQAFILGGFTFFLTVLGAGTIFLVKNINHKVLDRFIALSAGIMLASSIFSLIIPALDSATEMNYNTPVILSLGLLFGTIILYICDIYGSKVKGRNSNNLIISMIIHNIPEGMAIGVAFAGVYYGSVSSIMAAVSLAVGIGIQNFPEGSAISFPMYKNGNSKFKSFMIGGLTAIVEPFSALVGVFIASRFPVMLPVLLATAFGSMLYVIATELIPEIMAKKNKELMALYLAFGFIIMMILDISLG